MAPLAAVLTIIAGSPASAGAERYAIVAANNRGWGSDRPLRYAHRDAARLGRILREIGGFKRDNIVQIASASPARIEAAFRRLGTKIAGGGPAPESMLFFFYSGHGDERALHPGPASLPYDRLKRLIARVGVNVRVGVVDSCKSGSFALKGARQGPAFAISVKQASHVTGSIFLAATSRGENAQESDQLQGSYFSTYLSAGLRGAADADSDGKVTLSELYSYAYAMTVGSTSKTLAGVQHPAYRIDLRGQGDLVLTRPRRAEASLVFGKGRRTKRYLVLRERDEALVAEVPALPDREVRIGLPPGRYTVRRKTPRHVYQLKVALLTKEQRRIKDDRMEPVILPGTLTKGELLGRTWSVGIGYTASLMDLDSTLPLHRLRLSVRAPLGHWSLEAHVQGGARSYDGDLFDVTTAHLALGLAFKRDIATPVGLIGLGPALGYSVDWQSNSHYFEDRIVSGLFAGASLSVDVPLPVWRLAIGLDTWAGYLVLSPRDEPQHRVSVQTTTSLKAWF